MRTRDGIASVMALCACNLFAQRAKYEFCLASPAGGSTYGVVDVSSDHVGAVVVTLFSPDGRQVRETDLRDYVDRVDFFTGPMTGAGEYGGRRLIVVGRRHGKTVLLNATVSDDGRVTAESAQEILGHRFSRAIVVPKARSALLLDVSAGEIVAVATTEVGVIVDPQPQVVVRLREFALVAADMWFAHYGSNAVVVSARGRIAKGLWLEKVGDKWVVETMSAAHDARELVVRRLGSVDIASVFVESGDASHQHSGDVVMLTDWDTGLPVAHLRMSDNMPIDLRETAAVPGRSYYFVGKFPAESRRFVPAIRRGAAVNARGLDMGSIMIDGRDTATAEGGFWPFVRLARGGAAALDGNLWLLVRCQVGGDMMSTHEGVNVLEAQCARPLVADQDVAMAHVRMVGAPDNVVGRRVFVQVVWLGAGDEVAVSDICGVVLSNGRSGYHPKTQTHAEVVVADDLADGDGQVAEIEKEVIARLGRRSK
jgi:hypothetical protein